MPQNADDLEPTFDQLRKLLAFVEGGGVSAAADRLGMDQSTLSRRLAVFKKPGADEQAILETHGNQLQLTAKGEAVLPVVRDLIRQYEQFLKHLEDARRQPQIVRLGLGHFAAEQYLPLALMEVWKHEPPFAVDVQIVRGKERILGVANGEFDLAVVTHDPPQIKFMLEVHLERQSELEIHPLARQPFCVVASKDSAMGQELAATPANRKLPLKRLADWSFVGLDRDSGIRRLIEAELRRIDRTLQFVERTGTGGWAAAKEFAREGIGAALLPLALVSPDDGATLVVRRMADQIAIPDYIIHRPQTLNSAQESLKQALMAAARKHQKIMVSPGTLK